MSLGVAPLAALGPLSVVAPLAVLGLLVTIYFAAFWAASPEHSLFSGFTGDGALHDESDSSGESGAGDDGDADDGDSDDADGPNADGDSDEADDQPPETRIGPRWDPGTTVALLAGAGGILTKNTTMFLAGAVGFVYAAYRYGTRAPEVSVAIERAISDRSPLPSDEVEVTLTLRNDGEEPIPDLRVVDGVPEQLGVSSGSPRFGTSLQPGEAAAFSYEVRARRGTHEFGETRLVARNVSGSAERRWEREADLPDAPDPDEAATITCETRADDVPLPADTASHPGQITTDSGGEGVEFYATREYQPADPMSRIDWKRYAKTRELTTVDFRETQAATVVLVVDTRTPAHVSRRSGEPDAVELTRYAAERLAEAFVRRNDRVGLALFGPAERYLDPGGGEGQLARVRAELDATPEASDHGIGLFDESRRQRANESRFETLRKRMPDGAQVVFLSPMADEYAVEVVRRFKAYGHAVTVVSPDVTGSETAGGSVERIERDRRLGDLRGPVRVVDWSPDEPIRSAVSKATARWSG
ncbi:DUF58 domain-containing protein (plasmid) [Halorussus limi]|uniref:DUF58 domain-containing protein n=1 Tax=Halorussus limi TaxID=2938695 RepID=A0A8U0HZU0_9EURY|nr:DUF58 domain-containing protein [Halorussus limi]UPV76447.1 DUF58 domain-containing protein [Halorussus limi]